MRRLYIKGMEMPRCCNDCRFAVWREADGRAYDYIVQCQALPEGDDDEIEWILTSAPGAERI